MGGRQSHDQSHGPSPVQVSAPRPPHRPPPPRQPPQLASIQEYSRLHRGQPPPLPVRSSAQPQPPAPRRVTLDSGDLLQLDLALSTLQQRLAERTRPDTAPRERPHTHHHRRHHHRPHSAALSAGMPLIFVRNLPSLKCPLCSRDVQASDMEEHLAQCMAKPRVTYNSDKLTQEAGECSICLEDLLPGNEIARLPCLCIYHLKCLKQWFKVSQTCPEHPDLA